MNKNSLLIVASILLLFAHAEAQKGKELILGVSGALTGTFILNQNFYGEPEIDYAPKMGYGVSFNLGYNFTENISVISELNYSLQGQKYDGKQTMDGTKYDTKRDINLRYLNIPLFFKYAFGKGTTKFRFMVGPQYSILLEATQEYTRNDKKLGTTAVNNDGQTFVTDANTITERFIDNDFSIALDIGADIHLSDKFYIGAGFRTNYGFNDINAEAYRIKDLDGEYTPSHNVWGGIYVGINYKIDVEGYSQRSF